MLVSCVQDYPIGVFCYHLLPFITRMMTSWACVRHAIRVLGLSPDCSNGQERVVSKQSVRDSTLRVNTFLDDRRARINRLSQSNEIPRDSSGANLLLIDPKS